MSAANLVQKVEVAITLAEQGVSALPPEALAIHGMTSFKVRHFLCNLAARRYLEVGVWCGATFCAATHSPQTELAVAVDNFSLFNDDGYVRGRFLAAVGLWCHAERFQLQTRSWFEVQSRDMPTNIDVFLYDGDHSQEATEHGIVRVWPALANQAIILVDDTNFTSVAAGIAGAWQQLGVRPVQQWNLPARHNGDLDQWWNGLYVAVVDKIGMRPIDDTHF